MLYVEIAIVVVLICVNGLLSMSELAIVSSRPARLKAMIDRGVNGAGRALDLGSNPGKFLSSVQIGITLVGVLSGAFSGATLGDRLSVYLASTGIRENIADPLGVGIVVAIITYFSLIVGELVPKQIALRDPERVAARVAPAMTILATVSAPLVFLLDFSGRAILWLLGQRGESEEKVTDEEARTRRTDIELDTGPARTAVSAAIAVVHVDRLRTRRAGDAKRCSGCSSKDKASHCTPPVRPLQLTDQRLNRTFVAGTRPSMSKRSKRGTPSEKLQRESAADRS